MIIPLIFIVAPSATKPLGVFVTPHNAAGFLRDHPEAEGAVVLEHQMEMPAAVHAPIRWRYVGGKVVGPAGKRSADMFTHLQVE